MVLLLAVSLVGSIADTVYDSRFDNKNDSDLNQTGTNVTGTTGVLLSLVTLLFSAGVVVMGYRMFIGSN